MKIKRILSVLLTLVIVAGLSGCGNKSKKDNNSNVRRHSAISAARPGRQDQIGRAHV